MFRQFALEEVIVESVDVQCGRPRLVRGGIACGGRIAGLLCMFVNHERRMVLRAIAGLDGMDVERFPKERVLR